MIMKKLVVIFGAGLLALAAVSCGTTTKMTVEQREALRTAIENRDFTITVDKALPQTGSMVNLTSPYSLTIKGDSVYSYLPYFGRAYSIPYGGGVGLNFNGTFTNYNVASGKRGATIITFQAQSPDEKVEYTVDIESEGSATITAHSQNRQQIRFIGKMEDPAKK